MEKFASRNNDAPLSQEAEDTNNVTPVEVDGAAITPRQKKHFSFYMTILMLAMIGLFIAWDATALALALPVIAEGLHGTSFQSFWASIAFILGVAITQPIYASISDVVGRKYPLYASIILFLIGSVVFSTATNMNVVVIGRLIKGLGGGGLDVLQTIILCDITTLKERPRWLGVMSIANAVGAVTGPFIGAAFAQETGWPWLGWINLMAVGLSGVLAFFFLHLTPIEGDMKSKIRQLDWSGFGLFLVISTAVTLPLSWADALYGWGSWQTLVPLLIGLLLIVPFTVIERKAAAPLIPYQIFDNISITIGTVTAFFYGALVNSILLYLPLFFQAVYLETPIQAAMSTLPICSLLVGANIIVSALIHYIRKCIIIIWAGWGLTAIFLGLHYIVGFETNKAQSYTFQALLGAGLGMVMVATVIAVLASVRKVDYEGLAAGMLVTTRFLGSLISLAICSTIFNSMFEKSFSSIKDLQLPEQLEVLRDSSQAMRFIPRLREVDLPEDAMHAIIGVYQDAFHTIWVTLAAFAGLATLLSLLMSENSLEKDEVGRQGFKAPSSE